MTFIAQNYQKEFEREKIARLIVALLALLGTTIFIGTIFMLPSYFVLALSRDDVLRRLKAAEEVLATKELAGVEAEIRAVNSKIANYEKSGSRRYALSPILIKIAKTMSADIKISGINLGPSDAGSFIITLMGEAQKRESLLKFIDNLRILKEFDSVYSPVTNLLKETNAPFRLEIKLKPEIYNHVK